MVWSKLQASDKLMCVVAIIGGFIALIESILQLIDIFKFWSFGFYVDIVAVILAIIVILLGIKPIPYTPAILGVLGILLIILGCWIGGIVILFSISIVIIVILNRNSASKQKSIPSSINIPQKDRKISEEIKYELFGIISLHKKLDFAQASKIMEISEADLKRMVYQLVGRGEINGKMEENAFIIETEVDQFINSLDEAFSNWQGFVDSSEGKV